MNFIRSYFDHKVSFHTTTAVMGLKPPQAYFQGLHSDTPHSVGLLWKSDQPDTETTVPHNIRHT
jgi:hypothetical protein